MGSRKSALALVQTNWVIDQLSQLHPGLQFEVVTIDTTGDNILDRPLAKIGEKALFTRELEDELLAGNIDLIVHSLKDLPTTLPDDCCIGAITRREDPTDSLVLRTGLHLPRPDATLEEILANNQSITTFGTSSLRRIAQLRTRCPAVTVKDVRGNINTRIRKLDAHDEHGYDCLVMATAGLVRGGFAHRISHRLNWYHAVSQGALGVECRTDDAYMVTEVLAPLVDQRALLECLAERVLMKCLEGGCSVPIGVRTRWSEDIVSEKTELTLEAIVLSLNGTQRVEATATQPLDDTQSLPANAQRAMPTEEEGRLDWSLFDFTDVSVRHFDDQLQVRLHNAVLLGRRLATMMIDRGVRDILSAINRAKQQDQ